MVLDYDYDFLLFGISCHVKDYRMCWALNKKLGISLKKEENLLLPVQHSEEVNEYPFYSYSDEAFRIKYIVAGNRGTKGLLVKEQKQVDFFLLIEGHYEIVNTYDLLKKLKEIDVILAAFELNPNHLKSKQNLLFE